jgi:arginase
MHRAAAGRLPILLGGDHCLAIGSISAVARHCRAAGKKLRVLWLDAHADFNTSALTPSGNLHGMPVACLCGHGPPSWCRSAARCRRRSPAGSAPDRHPQRGPGREALRARAGWRCSTCATSTRWACATRWSWRWPRWTPNTHLHVSFDVDFLDPEIAPGVGTTVPGGPTYREAQLCMEMIADTGRLASLDIVELNPALDVRNKTAETGGGPGRKPVRQEHADAQDRARIQDALS